MHLIYIYELPADNVTIVIDEHPFQEFHSASECLRLMFVTSVYDELCIFDQMELIISRMCRAEPGTEAPSELQRNAELFDFLVESTLISNLIAVP